MRLVFLNRWLVLAMLCVFFAPYTGWCAFIFPVADDFAFVNWDLSWSGVFGHMRDTVGGSNLYVSVLARWLHAHLTAIGLYGLSPIACMLLHFFGGIIAFRVFARCGLRLPASPFLLSAAWCAWYLSTMPSSAQTIYWATPEFDAEESGTMH